MHVSSALRGSELWQSGIGRYNIVITLAKAQVASRAVYIANAVSSSHRHSHVIVDKQMSLEKCGREGGRVIVLDSNGYLKAPKCLTKEKSEILHL